jgi:hypothetical protein
VLHKRDGVTVTVCSQVLLELSDVELEVGLGITHPMHRKKLRLAIEEHRHPALVRYPCIAQLGHTWVSSEWLPDLGLAQASAMFHGHFTYLAVVIRPWTSSDKCHVSWPVHLSSNSYQTLDQLRQVPSFMATLFI